ncbi:MAG: hypothetical protein JWP61_858 [Friedmanniella sp.]|nr:hypothetical protein [Friedmanniella sp.]
MSGAPTSKPPAEDRRWPRHVYGVGTEPDPRFTFANERTFLAWIRTALGFLAAGVAVAAVARYSAQLSVEVRLASAVLVGCGLACGLSAWVRWVRNERAMRRGDPLPSSPVLLVLTGVVVAVALVALVVVSFAG